MGGGAGETCERKRDTGFMLEWMFFAEGLQLDCSICYFLRTAGEKNKTSSEPENWNIIWGIVEVFVCTNVRGAVYVFALFVYSHVVHMCLHVCSVSLADQENMYLFVICEGVTAERCWMYCLLAVERMEEYKRSKSGVQKETGREREDKKSREIMLRWWV